MVVVNILSTDDGLFNETASVETNTANGTAHFMSHCHFIASAASPSNSLALSNFMSNSLFSSPVAFICVQSRFASRADRPFGPGIIAPALGPCSPVGRLPPPPAPVEVMKPQPHFTLYASHPQLGQVSLTNPQLGLGSLIYSHLGLGSLTNPQLGLGSLTYPQLGLGSLTNPQLGQVSLTNPQLGLGSLTYPQLGLGSLT